MCSLLVSLLLSACDGFLIVSQPISGSRHRVASTSLTARAVDESNTDNHITRRSIFQVASISIGASLFAPQSALAADLDDLPPQAARSYLQYRMPLQTGADYYLWTLQEKIKDTNDWGEIGELFQTNSARSGGQRKNAEFVAPTCCRSACILTHSSLVV